MLIKFFLVEIGISIPKNQMNRIIIAYKFVVKNQHVLNKPTYFLVTIIVVSLIVPIVVSCKV